MSIPTGGLALLGEGEGGEMAGPYPTGNPVTDRTTLQGLLDTAGTGGTAVPGPGVWALDQGLRIPDGVALEAAAARPFGAPNANYGSGAGLPVMGAILKPAATFTGAQVILLDGVTGGGQHGGQMISRIAIDGSSLPGGNTVDGIASAEYVAAVTLRDVLVYGGYTGSVGLGGNGLDFQSAGGHAPDFFDVAHVKVSSCKGAGIQLAGLADSIFTAVEATGNNGDNWHVTNGSNSRYIGCKGENSGGGWDFNLIGISGFTGYTEWIGLTGGGGASGSISVSGAGSGTYYFLGTHIVSGATSVTGSNTVKSSTWPTTGSIVTS